VLRDHARSPSFFSFYLILLLVHFEMMGYARGLPPKRPPSNVPTWLILVAFSLPVLQREKHFEQALCRFMPNCPPEDKGAARLPPRLVSGILYLLFFLTRYTRGFPPFWGLRLVPPNRRDPLYRRPCRQLLSGHRTSTPFPPSPVMFFRVSPQVFVTAPPIF